jgi:hypothetical protein
MCALTCSPELSHACRYDRIIFTRELGTFRIMGDMTVPDRVHTFRRLELSGWLERVTLGGAHGASPVLPWEFQPKPRSQRTIA